MSRHSWQLEWISRQRSFRLLAYKWCSWFMMLIVGVKSWGGFYIFNLANMTQDMIEIQRWKWVTSFFHICSLIRKISVWLHAFSDGDYGNFQGFVTFVSALQVLEWNKRWLRAMHLGPRRSKRWIKSRCQGKCLFIQDIKVELNDWFWFGVFTQVKRQRLQLAWS